MKVIVELDVADQERELITKYYRITYGTKGLPKLATRKMIKDLVLIALESRYLRAADDVEDQVA